MRLSEVHPALAHFPVALLPVAIAADACARRTSSRELESVGRVGVTLAAVSAAAAGVFGLIAQEEVEVDEHARRILQTHRTLNIVALGLVTALAIRRRSARRASTSYLLLGLAATAVVSFSAYLGGKLVYTHGVGVEKTGGIGARAPAVLPPEGPVVKTAVRQLGSGLAHTVREMIHGELVPYFAH